MICSALLKRLLMILSIISLTAAPLTVTARGEIAAEMASMMDVMDCCPSGDPVMPDCQKSCPYLALCMAKCFPATNVTFTRLAFLDAVSNSHRISPDENVDAWSIRPPAPPPRIQDIADA